MGGPENGGIDIGDFFSIHPKEDWSVSVLNLAPQISNPAQSLQIQLTWNAFHRLDFVGLTAEAPVEISVEECPLLSATHSTSGSVWNSVHLPDTFYAELIPGEQIDLKFSVPALAAGLERSFVIVSTGYFTAYSQGGGSQGTTGIGGLPRVFALYQNAPNPFQNQTTFRYGLPVPTHVNIKIYDITERLVKTLVNEIKKAGYYSIAWNGKDNGDRGVASGIYFYRFKAGDFVKTKKMIFLR